MWHHSLSITRNWGLIVVTLEVVSLHINCQLHALLIVMSNSWVLFLNLFYSFIEKSYKLRVCIILNNINCSNQRHPHPLSILTHPSSSTELVDNPITKEAQATTNSNLVMSLCPPRLSPKEQADGYTHYTLLGFNTRNKLEPGFGMLALQKTRLGK